jgi:L-aminopeptidase/D-esterase-like protein
MAGRAVNRFAWMMKRGLARIGWTGAAGLGLLAFAAAFAASAVAQRVEERAALNTQAEHLRARYRLAQSTPGAAKPGKARQLRTFYEFCPH